MRSLPPFLPRGRTVLLPVLGLALSACASLPDLPASPAARTPAGLSVGHTLQDNHGEWARDQWWRDYRDSQLDALMQEALAGSPDMDIARARLLAAEGLTRQAGGALQPQLDLNASVVSQKQSYNTGLPVPRGINDSGSLSLDASWQLDFWGRNRSLLAAARSSEAASRADLAAARLLLTSSVANSYAELARLYALRDLARETVGLRSQSAALIANRQRNGLENQASQQIAASRLAAAQAELVAADEALRLQANQLAALLGKGPDRAEQIRRPSIDLSRVRQAPSDLMANLLGRRPDIVAARWRVEAARGNVAAAHAAFYPNVNLSASVGMQSLGLGWLTRNGSGTGSVGLAFNLPLFHQGELQGSYQVQRASYDEAVANYDKTLIHALQEIGNNLVSSRAVMPQLGWQQQAEQGATQARNIAQARYRAGLANRLDVINAEDTLLDSQRALVNTRARLLTLDIALIAALGGGYGADAR